MREYQRDRRARLRAESGAAVKPVVAKRPTKAARRSAELGRPRTQQEKRWDAELDALDTCGRNAMWNGDGYSDAGSITPTPTPKLSPPLPVAPSRTLALHTPALRGEIIPPPRSMIADGGTEPRGYAPGASIAEATAAIRALAAHQTRVNEELAQRLAALERTKAETERRLTAIEERRAGVVAIVQGLAGMFSLVGRAG